jgi:hypothetical protein
MEDIFLIFLKFGLKCKKIGGLCPIAGLPKRFASVWFCDDAAGPIYSIAGKQIF